MAWLRHVVVDLLVMLCILLATAFEQTWAGWVVLVYTPLMLVLRLAAFAMPRLGADREDEVPAAFYHVLYAVDAGLLLYHGWGWAGAGWLLIWALSAAHDLRRRRPGVA